MGIESAARQITDNRAAGGWCYPPRGQQRRRDDMSKSVISDRPVCSACAQDQIYDRSGRIRRAVVRVGICREPYVLRLCQPHMVQLQRVLPEGGLRVIEQYQPDSNA